MLWEDKPDIDRRVTPRAAPTVIGAYAFENLNWNASVKSTFTDESGQPFLVNGVNVFGPVDHGFCQSIYFAGPEDLSLEISTSAEAIDARAWIDPEVVALAGISADELVRFRTPPPLASAPSPVPQPPAEPDKPHMRFSERGYAKMLAMTDEEYTRLTSEPEPPVKVAAAE